RKLGPWFGPLRAVTQAAGPGRFFGNYELLSVLDVGGQGVVYKARQVQINKVVALKVVNPGDRRRPLRDLEIAADLEHEHLVRVCPVGEQDGRLYFTMKLAENGSLARHVADFALPAIDPNTGEDSDGRAWSATELNGRKGGIAALVAKVARAVAYVH